MLEVLYLTTVEDPCAPVVEVEVRQVEYVEHPEVNVVHLLAQLQSPLRYRIDDIQYNIDTDRTYKFVFSIDRGATKLVRGNFPVPLSYVYQVSEGHERTVLDQVLDRDHYQPANLPSLQLHWSETFAADFKLQCQS
jgi:hypothetical protein